MSKSPLNRNPHIKEAHFALVSLKGCLADLKSQGWPDPIIAMAAVKVAEARRRFNAAIIEALDERNADRDADEQREREAKAYTKLLADVLTEA